MHSLAVVPHFVETLQYLSGFAITLITLAFMAMITALVGQYFIRKEQRVVAVGEPQKEASSSAAIPKAQQGISPEIVAVVAAAVHVCLGKIPHQIVSIKPADSSWSREGRRQIFDSHRVR